MAWSDVNLDNLRCVQTFDRYFLPAMAIAMSTQDICKTWTPSLSL